MSMGLPNLPDSGGEMDEEIEEITVDVTEDGHVWLHGADWELVLSAAEARQLGQALQDAADDAEGPAELPETEAV